MGQSIDILESENFQLEEVSKVTDLDQDEEITCVSKMDEVKSLCNDDAKKADDSDSFQVLDPSGDSEKIVEKSSTVTDLKFDLQMKAIEEIESDIYSVCSKDGNSIILAQNQENCNQKFIEPKKVNQPKKDAN